MAIIAQAPAKATPGERARRMLDDIKVALVPSSGPVRRNIPWRRVALQAAGMWLATRVGLALVTYFVVAHSGAAQPDAAISFNVDVLGSWQRLDAFWFLRISQSGYSIPLETAFFPLYPALVALVTVVLGEAHRLAAALLVSNLAALAAFIGVGFLAANEDGAETAAPSVRVLAAFPLAFFLAAPYTDSLLLAFIPFTLLFARRGNWLAAAACAFFAGLSRPVALALVLPLVWEYGRQHEWWHRDAWAARWRELRWRHLLLVLRSLLEPILVAGAVLAAIALYAGFLWTQFGHPLIFLHVQGLQWGHETVTPWKALALAAHTLVRYPVFSFSEARQLIDLAPVVVALILTLVAARRMPLAFTLYMLGELYLSVSSPRLTSHLPFTAAGRYTAQSVPLFLLLGRWSTRRPWLDTLIVGGGFMLQALLAAYFLRGGDLI
jgi:hypothetical protein